MIDPLKSLDESEIATARARSAPTVIRCSALTGYPDCERRGAARLFWREIVAAGFKLRFTPRSIGAAIGTAVHKGAAIDLAEKAKDGKLPPVNVPIDAAVDELREQLRGGEIMFDGAERGVTRDRDEAVRQSASMARAYHTGIAPAVEPIRVEHRLEAEIAPGFILSGQSDLVCREPQSLRDLKTGARAPSSAAPQIGGYSLLNRSHKMTIQTARIDFVQRVRPNKTQPDPVSSEVEIARAETAAAMVLTHILKGIDTFRHGDPERNILPGDPWAFLANPSSILCSAKYCPAHGTDFCHEWQPK
jgi:hypothetical protein